MAYPYTYAHPLPANTAAPAPHPAPSNRPPTGAAKHAESSMTFSTGVNARSTGEGTGSAFVPDIAPHFFAPTPSSAHPSAPLHPPHPAFPASGNDRPLAYGGPVGYSSAFSHSHSSYAGQSFAHPPQGPPGPLGVQNQHQSALPAPTASSASTAHNASCQPFPPDVPFGVAPPTIHALSPSGGPSGLPSGPVNPQQPSVARSNLLGILNGKASSRFGGIASASPAISSNCNTSVAPQPYDGHTPMAAQHTYSAPIDTTPHHAQSSYNPSNTSIPLGTTDIHHPEAPPPLHQSQPFGLPQSLEPLESEPYPDKTEGEAEMEEEELDQDSIFRDMTFDEVLEELNARFLVNLPREEMGLVRVYWQAEQAHWFYEDYLRPLNPHLPSLSQRQFSQLIIASSPIYPILAAAYSSSSSTSSSLTNPTTGIEVAGDPAILSVVPQASPAVAGVGAAGKGKGKGKGKNKQAQHQGQAQGYGQGIEMVGIDYDAVWAEYVAYKSMVPCCGGIILNEAGDKALVVRGWKSSAGWCFPRGKININEPELECAIREVYEETGFDLTGYIKDPARDRIQTQINAQTVTMFVAMGVWEGTRFGARTKKEIGAIEWVPLTDLPTWSGRKPKRGGANDGRVKRYYNVTPFVGPLKKWLVEHGVPLKPRKNAQMANTFPADPHGSAHSTGNGGMGGGIGSYATSDYTHTSTGPAPVPGARDLQPFFGAIGGPVPAIPAVPVLPAAPAQAKSHAQMQRQVQVKNQKATALDELFGQFASVAPVSAPLSAGLSGSGMQNQDRAGGRNGRMPAEGFGQAGGISAAGEGGGDGLAKLFGNLGTGTPAAPPASAFSGGTHAGMRAGRPEEVGTRQADTATNGPEQVDMDSIDQDALALLLGSPVRKPLAALAALAPPSASTIAGAGTEKQKKLLALLGGGKATTPGPNSRRASNSQGVDQSRAPGPGQSNRQLPYPVPAPASESAIAAPPADLSSPPASTLAAPLPAGTDTGARSAGDGDQAKALPDGMTRRQSNLLSMLSPPQAARSLSGTSPSMHGHLHPTPSIPPMSPNGANVGRTPVLSSKQDHPAGAREGVFGSPESTGNGAEGDGVGRKARQADLLKSLTGLGGTFGSIDAASSAQVVSNGVQGTQMQAGDSKSGSSPSGILSERNVQLAQPYGIAAGSAQRDRLLSALNGPLAGVGGHGAHVNGGSGGVQQYTPVHNRSTSGQYGSGSGSGLHDAAKQDLPIHGAGYGQYGIHAPQTYSQSPYPSHNNALTTATSPSQRQNGYRSVSGTLPSAAHADVVHPVPKAGATLGLLAMLNGK